MPKSMITIERLEDHLDMLARIMDRAGRDAEKYLPIWRALERAIAERQEATTILHAAQLRLRRSRDRTEARS